RPAAQGRADDDPDAEPKVVDGAEVEADVVEVPAGEVEVVDEPGEAHVERGAGDVVRELEAQAERALAQRDAHVGADAERGGEPSVTMMRLPSGSSPRRPGTPPSSTKLGRKRPTGPSRSYATLPSPKKT